MADYQYTWDNFISDPYTFAKKTVGAGWNTVSGGLDSIGTSLDKLGVTDPSSAFWREKGMGQSLTTLGLGAYAAMQQQKAMQDQLNFAKQQFAWDQDFSRANFQTQGTGALDKGLWQLQALNAFDPTAGSERAQNYYQAATNMNNAATSIGAAGFQNQLNQIQKYQQ